MGCLTWVRSALPETIHHYELWATVLPVYSEWSAFVRWKFPCEIEWQWIRDARPLRLQRRPLQQQERRRRLRTIKCALQRTRKATTVAHMRCKHTCALITAGWWKQCKSLHQKCFPQQMINVTDVTLGPWKSSSTAPSLNLLPTAD